MVNVLLFIRPVSQEDPDPRRIINSDNEKQTKMRTDSHYSKPESSCPTLRIFSKNKHLTSALLLKNYLYICM